MDTNETLLSLTLFFRKRKLTNYDGYHRNCRICCDGFSGCLLYPETNTKSANDKPCCVRVFYRVRRDAGLEMADHYLQCHGWSDTVVSFVFGEEEISDR